MAASDGGMAVTLTGPEARTSSGTASITLIPPGRRNLHAALLAVAGLALGGASILIPILHLCTVWFLPLLGCLLAARALRRTFSIRELNGPCPACRAKIHMGGRELPDSEWQSCPHCGARVRVQPST
ncbi:MAG: hypothetical protein JNK53_01600 [Phycisphaerae bacterium]|nr:hypothetical protein [Phycisphaerae bacterium]